MIRIARLKGGVGGEQHLVLQDKKDLKRLKAKSEGSRYVFLSERGDPMSRDGFAKLLDTIGSRTDIDPHLVHPHSLRHAAGHFLANSGRVNAYQLQAILGHRDARSTNVYVSGVAAKIKGLWD